MFEYYRLYIYMKCNNISSMDLFLIRLRNCCSAVLSIYKIVTHPTRDLTNSMIQ